MTKFALQLALTAVLSAGLMPLSFASGSGGNSAAAQGQQQRLYNMGKGVYADKLSCTNCPLAGKRVTVEIAKDLLAGNPQVTLSAEEREALTAYLKQRFSL